MSHQVAPGRPVLPPTSLQDHTTAPSPNQGLQQAPVRHMDYTNVDPTVLKAARGMESVFLNQMIQIMRKSIPKSEYSLDSNAVQIYRGMLDGEIAKKMANSGGVGLADLIIDYLTRPRYTVPRRAPSTWGAQLKKDKGKKEISQSENERTGGTYEGPSSGQ